MKFFAQISLSRDPLQGKNIFFFDFSHAKYTEMIPNTHWSFLIFFGEIFFVHPGGYHGSGTRNEPPKKFFIGTFYSYFSISDRMTLVSSKSEHFENRRQNWGGSSKPHPCPKKIFLGWKRKLSSRHEFWYPICPPSSKDIAVITKWANPYLLSPYRHRHSMSLVWPD